MAVAIPVGPRRNSKSPGALPEQRTEDDAQTAIDGGTVEGDGPWGLENEHRCDNDMVSAASCLREAVTMSVEKRGRAKSEALFSDEERAAMREAVRERKARARPGKSDGETDVRTKIAEMHGSDRAIAERFHEIVKATAPGLLPRTWYGMPAYSKDDEVLCWFTPAEKFKARYATVSFGDGASLDEGRMWPVSFAVTTMTAAEEDRIVALLKRAVGSG